MEPNHSANAYLQIVKKEYKNAFTLINQGLAADEAGQRDLALRCYKLGHGHLLQGLSVSSQDPECRGAQWDSVRQMQGKMQETLNNVEIRLNIMERNAPSRSHNSSSGNGLPRDLSEQPPLYPLLPPSVVQNLPPNPQNPSSESALPRNKSEGSQLYPSFPQKEKPERPPPFPSNMPNPELQSGHVSPPVSGSGTFASASPLSPGSPVIGTEQPPAYTPEAVNGHYTLSYGTESGEFSLVGDDFYSQGIQPPPVQSLGVDAEELLLIPHGVQLFYVTPDGQVSAPSYPGYLRIVKFTDTDGTVVQGRPPAFLQVCDWLYPLMSNQSPVLLCNTGVFMFPDVMSQVQGSFVGVVLSSGLAEADRELFQDLLRQMTDLRVQPPEAPDETSELSRRVPVHPDAEAKQPEVPQWSEKVAHGILSGASWLSWGLVKGAEYTGKAIHLGASKLREHIHPEDKPVAVSPAVAKGLHVAKQATGGAVKVSQFLVDGVCCIASKAGKELAPHVKKHGSKLVPDSIKKDKDGKSTFDGALAVAASGVQGFSTVWQGLECAAKSIAKSVASETVKTVKHKYGTDAGQATDSAVNSAINVGVTAFNIDNLGIKAVVKRTAKETSRAVLDDYNLTEKPQEKKGL
ncbi:spartin isoform X2 [Protopterus annectens]|nr:spartin isoform X2 [Protopterus annectens]XP_043929302.1 spartin isoform X2 [Protopterus annectens]